MKCDKCDGLGTLKDSVELVAVDNGKIWMTTKMCLRCHGEGKLDWIENVVGKHIVDPMDLQLKIQSHPTTTWGPYEEV
jgi:hypothetical protein